MYNIAVLYRLFYMIVYQCPPYPVLIQQQESFFFLFSIILHQYIFWFFSERITPPSKQKNIYLLQFAKPTIHHQYINQYIKTNGNLFQVCVSACLYVCIFLYLSLFMSVCLSACLTVSICSVCESVCQSICILLLVVFLCVRDFLKAPFARQSGKAEGEVGSTHFF